QAPAQKAAPQTASPAQSEPAAPHLQSPPADPPAQGAIAATSESEWTLETALYHLVFSNRGAVVTSWTLRKFQDSDKKPLELVNDKGAAKAGFPFSLDFRGQKPSTDLNNALWVAHPSSDGLSIEYDYSDG